MESTSTSLLEQLRDADNRTAWDRFVDLYSPVMYSWGNRMGLQSTDIEDVVQDTFVVVFRQIRTLEYDSGRSFRAWLKTVFRTKWIDRQRRRKLQIDEISLSQLVDGEKEEDAVDRRLLLKSALAIIEPEFSAKNWAVFLSYFVEGQEPAAISSRFSVSVATVYAVASKVKRRLRDILGPQENR